MTFVPVTVGRARDGFTVTRGPAPAFTVTGPAPAFTATGHPGGTNLDHALLTEDGAPLLLESGAYLLTA